MARKLITTAVHLTPEQHESLKLLSARTRVPVAVYIREAIELVIARYPASRPE